MADPAPPGRIVVAGDWHGNTEWAVHVIGMAAGALAGESRKTIIHLGDFGIWPGQAGRDYLARVSAALEKAGAELWFVDGNHEDFTRLSRELERAPLMAWGSRAPIPVGSGPVRIGARILWLWRGFRWTWHGREWLALGGGVSLDKAIRTEGETWWPQEEITPEQAAKVIAGGGADVMVTHDCPSGVRHTFPSPPSFWDARDLARSDAHRERLQRVTDAVQPSHLMHGHLHRSYQRMCDFGYGPAEVTGLDCDEGDGANWAVLDVRTMTWSADTPQEREPS
jgi:hypothetical protein